MTVLAIDDRADRLLAVLVDRLMAAGLIKRRGRTATTVTTPNRLQMTFDGGSYALAVDGRDVTQDVAAVDVHADPGGPPSVVQTLRPSAALAVELVVPTRVVVGAPVDPEPAVAAFLEALDPVEVERVALARSDLESVPGGGTAAVLRQVAEWACGA